jgi:hypothetical protein
MNRADYPCDALQIEPAIHAFAVVDVVRKHAYP